MKAFERYELTLNQFMVLRHEGKDITLREYCKEKLCLYSSEVIKGLKEVLYSISWLFHTEIIILTSWNI